MEEIHWVQRSLIIWLMFGDKNTYYFQNFSSSRRLRNRIIKLIEDQGAWLEGTDPVFLEKVNPRVTNEMNEALLKPYTVDDVKKAIFSIGDMKALGTDGLHDVFLRRVGISLVRLLL